MAATCIASRRNAALIATNGKKHCTDQENIHKVQYPCDGLVNTCCAQSHHRGLPPTALQSVRSRAKLLTALPGNTAASALQAVPASNCTLRGQKVP